MRLVFACIVCGTRYLPPDGLVYPDGSRAGAVWCSPCQGEALARGEQEPAVLAAVALFAAVRAMEAALRAVTSDLDPHRLDVRPSRPARTRRAGRGPGAARSRLG